MGNKEDFVVQYIKMDLCSKKVLIKNKHVEKLAIKCKILKIPLKKFTLVYPFSLYIMGNHIA